MTEFQIKNFEMEFYKNNKKLIELENLRIQLVESYLYKKKFQSLDEKFLEKIKINGIIPFTKYARNAFIAKKILNSLKENNYINLSKMNKVLNSLNTITSQFLSLSKKQNKKNLKQSQFLKIYFII